MGSLLIDKRNYEVLQNSKQLQLNHTEFDILWLLASRPGRIYSPEEMLSEIYLPFPQSTVEKVTNYIQSLKEKVGDHYIHLIEGQGYRLEYN